MTTLMTAIPMDIFPYAGIEPISLCTLVAFPIILLIIAMLANS